MSHLSDFINHVVQHLQLILTFQLVGLMDHLLSETFHHEHCDSRSHLYFAFQRRYVVRTICDGVYSEYLHVSSLFQAVSLWPALPPGDSPLVSPPRNKIKIASNLQCLMY